MHFYLIVRSEEKVKQTDIQLRLYRAILVAGIVLSVVSILGNCISDFPFLASLKWIVLLSIAVVALVFSNYKRYLIHMKFGIFLFLVCIFLPFAFVDSGGSNNNAMGYTFILLISITYLFNGWRRPVLVALLITVFIVMHALEYYYPEVIAVYSGWNQFVDRMIQIPLLLLVSFFILLQFAKEYERVNLKLTDFANIDELTGLYNRRMLNQAMEEAIKDSNAPIHLALLDLDNFKQVNDKYGHYTGDKVLKKLSAILQQTFKLNQHIISRWGGDEFAIIFYGKKDELIHKLEDIKKLYKEYTSVYEEALGISTSIVSFKEHDKLSQILIAADNKLYEEKKKKTC